MYVCISRICRSNFSKTLKFFSLDNFQLFSKHYLIPTHVCIPHVISIIICICVLQFLWALEAMMEAALALVVMTNMDDDVNWRWLLGLSAIPVGLISFVFPVSVCCVN